MCQGLLPLDSMDEIASDLASFILVCQHCPSRLCSFRYFHKPSCRLCIKQLIPLVCNTDPHVISGNSKWKKTHSQYINYALKPRYIKSTQDSGPSALQCVMDILCHLLSRLQKIPGLVLFSIVDVIRLVIGPGAYSRMWKVQKSRQAAVALVKVYHLSSWVAREERNRPSQKEFSQFHVGRRSQPFPLLAVFYPYSVPVISDSFSWSKSGFTWIFILGIAKCMFLLYCWATLRQLCAWIFIELLEQVLEPSWLLHRHTLTACFALIIELS